MTMIRSTAVSACAALLLALAAGCGLLDTEHAQHHRPGDARTRRGRRRPAALGALADFAFVKDGDGTQFVDG